MKGATIEQPLINVKFTIVYLIKELKLEIRNKVVNLITNFMAHNTITNIKRKQT